MVEGASPTSISTSRGVSSSPVDVFVEERVAKLEYRNITHFTEASKLIFTAQGNFSASQCIAARNVSSIAPAR